MLQQQLVKHSWNQQQIVQASHLLVICVDIKLDESDVERYFERVKEIRNTPDKIINSFKDYLKNYTNINIDMYDEFINIFGDIENLYSSNFLINHEKLQYLFHILLLVQNEKYHVHL